MQQVLIVDDEDQVRRMLRTKLEQCGHIVTEACDGQQALDLLRERPFDVVISDIIMPERDGLEIIMHLRKVSPDTRVIAISAPGNTLFLDSARALGASEAFEKPFRLEEIADAVARPATSGG